MQSDFGPSDGPVLGIVHNAVDARKHRGVHGKGSGQKQSCRRKKMMPHEEKPRLPGPRAWVAAARAKPSALRAAGCDSVDRRKRPLRPRKEFACRCRSRAGQSRGPRGPRLKFFVNGFAAGRFSNRSQPRFFAGGPRPACACAGVKSDEADAARPMRACSLGDGVVAAHATIAGAGAGKSAASPGYCGQVVGVPASGNFPVAASFIISAMCIAMTQ